MIPLSRPEWHLQAACRAYPPDWWHADETTVANDGHRQTVLKRIRQTEERAKRICRECPVIAECLRHALKHGEQGVWGGTTARERMAMRLNAEPMTGLCASGHDMSVYGVRHWLGIRPMIACRECRRLRSREYRRRGRAGE